MPTAARRLAHRILVRLETSNVVLAELLAEGAVNALAERERDFLHELVLGSLRRRGLLDHALAAVTSRPQSSLDPEVNAALRLGAHQILSLRVPDRAAVFESVDLVREHNPRAAGFVNAALRRLAREGSPATPEADTDALGWMATEGSLPRWIAARWLQQLGPAAALARAGALLLPPKASFRINPRASNEWSRIQQSLDPIALPLPGAWQARAGRPTRVAAAGLIYVQDQGSQLIAHLAARPGLVLDACAAPGGKAMLMADLVGSSGVVIAAEASRRRLGTLAGMVARWGAPNVRCVGADALRSPLRGRFDGILLDAPCSGLGTLSRHPDIRWRARARDLDRHAQRQRALLESLAPKVAVGGHLVYAVCSLEPEETVAVIDGFLGDHREFRIADPPSWALPFKADRFLTTTPEAHGGDGFFAAQLRRVE